MMMHSAVSYLGLHCLLRPFCPNTKSKYGNCKHCICHIHYVPATEGLGDILFLGLIMSASVLVSASALA